MKTVKATAPTRIDIAGGTLDLWPINHILDHKATVNFAISLPATATIQKNDRKSFSIQSKDLNIAISGTFAEICSNDKLPLVSNLLQAIWDKELPALDITLDAKSPAGAGLGGSSCLGVTFAAAVLRAKQEWGKGKTVPERDLLALVQDCEAKLIHAPTGIQDYWGAIRGGINCISYAFGDTRVETFKVSKLPALSEKLMVCYSGKSRASAMNNWEIFKRVFDRDRNLIASLNSMGKAAEDCATAVRAGDVAKVLASSRAEWQMRKDLWPGIETVETKKIAEAASNAGAEFSRVCGAGGGGVMAIFADPSKHTTVKKAVEAVGGQILQAEMVNPGLEVRVE